MLSTNIERLAAAHQRQIDDEAAEQDMQEAEELDIIKTPASMNAALDNLDAAEWCAMKLLIGQLIRQNQYHGEERDQGILDTAQEIYDLCYRAISEQATANRRAAMKDRP